MRVLQELYGIIYIRIYFRENIQSRLSRKTKTHRVTLIKSCDQNNRNNPNIFLAGEECLVRVQSLSVSASLYITDRPSVERIAIRMYDPKPRLSLDGSILKHLSFSCRLDMAMFKSILRKHELSMKNALYPIEEKDEDAAMAHVIGYVCQRRISN